MAGADGVGEASGTLIRGGGKEAGGFDFEVGASDGADLVEAEAVEFGHDVVFGGVGALEVLPVGEALVIGMGGLKAADGFGFLVVTIPGEPIVVAKDEASAGAEEAGDGLEDAGKVGEVLGGVVEGGDVELGFSFEVAGEAADHVEAGDALHEFIWGPAAVEALAGVEIFEDARAGFDEGIDAGVSAGTFKEKAEAVEAHAAADVDDVLVAAPGGEGFGPAEVAEFEGLAHGEAGEGVDAGGAPLVDAEEVGVAAPVVEGPAVDEADGEVGGARFEAGHEVGVITRGRGQVKRVGRLALGAGWWQGGGCVLLVLLRWPRFGRGFRFVRWWWWWGCFLW